MKNYTIPYSHVWYTSLWAQILLVFILVFCVTWMEKLSFNNPDFSDLIWLGATLIIISIFQSRLFRQSSLATVRWVVFGIFLLTVWRFLQWIFASRAGWVYGLIQLLLFPFQQVIPKELTTSDVIIWGLTVLTLLLILWGNNWLLKNFDIEWLRKGSLLWSLLFVLIVVIALYSNQPHVQENCFGVNAVSEGLSCRLRSNLGVMGSIWATLTFALCTLAIGWNYARSNRLGAQLLLVALQPVSIAIFFNPTRILGVVLLKVIRESWDQNLTENLLISMSTLNIIPIVVFFGIIPAGLLLLGYEKLRTWWTIGLATTTYAIMLGILLQTLYFTKSAFVYSTSEQILFLLMAVQSWLPLTLISFFPKNVHPPDILRVR